MRNQSDTQLLVLFLSKEREKKGLSESKPSSQEQNLVPELDLACRGKSLFSSIQEHLLNTRLVFLVSVSTQRWVKPT